MTQIINKVILFFCALFTIAGCSQNDNDAKISKHPKQKNSLTVDIGCLTDFDDSPHAYFSFKSGLAYLGENIDEENFIFPKDLDLLFDPPHGLGTNNTKLAKTLLGSGGIVDAGNFSIEDCKQAPLEGYKPFLKPEEIIKGHTYYIRTADGKSYGKIHVVDYNQEGKVLSFKWQFQSNGSRDF